MESDQATSSVALAPASTGRPGPCRAETPSPFSVGWTRMPMPVATPEVARTQPPIMYQPSVWISRRPATVSAMDALSNAITV